MTIWPFALFDGGKELFRFAHMAECAESVFEKILQFSQSCKLPRLSQQLEC